MITQISDLGEILKDANLPAPEWKLRSYCSGECLSYIAWNSLTKEALIVDPKEDDLSAYLATAQYLSGYLWLGVIDTHTHADHISVAPQIAQSLRAPLIMFEGNSNTRVDVRVVKDTALPSRAGDFLFLHTPGHTQDAMTVIWGPFVFAGDTVVIGDTGRDDLPGGNAEEHYDSLQKLKARLKPSMILLPGHDAKGARASSWGAELRENRSLNQGKEEFVSESNAFDAPAPALLKKSLKENLR